MAEQTAALQGRLGYRFHDLSLLERALTHRSAAPVHMERLEFLGDAVLGLVIAEHLHQRFSEADEGVLSRMRASVVRREALLRVAESWLLARAIRVGAGESEKGRLKSPSIAANAVEAVIGAVFLDGGWETARSLVLRAWQPLLEDVSVEDGRDAKSALQELTQARGWGLPEYSVQDLGAGHSPRFSACCRVQGRVLGEGYGDRKKQAEARAAARALEKLQRQGGEGS